MYPFSSMRSMQIIPEQMVKEAMDPPRDHAVRKNTRPACNRIILLLKRLDKRQKSCSGACLSSSSLTLTKKLLAFSVGCM